MASETSNLRSSLARFLTAPPSDDVAEIDAEFRELLGELLGANLVRVTGPLHGSGPWDAEPVCSRDGYPLIPGTVGCFACTLRGQP